MAKIIVAVHGMGEQFQQETIQSVADQFCQIATKKRRIVSLGSFHLDKSAKVVLFEAPPPPPKLSDSDVGFVEIYWGDIPRKIVDDRFTLEKTKKWGNSLAFRMKALRDADAGPNDTQAFDALDTAIPEIVEAIGVVETSMVLLKKANLPFYDVEPVLSSYLGDVQVVTEYPHYRRQIIDRFIEVFKAIAADTRTQLKDAEIHVIAHSEGAVVSFLALLEGLSSNDLQVRAVFERVRGFMTFGAPIDKHMIVWPELWKDYNHKFVSLRERRIRWRNYFDYADPIGAGLDETRFWLEKRTKWHRAFDFQPRHDFGYQRYWLPGVAHINYWKDRFIFKDFIEGVVTSIPEPVPQLTANGWSAFCPQPEDSPAAELTEKNTWAWLVGLTVPYVLAASILGLGVYALLKGILTGSEKDATGWSLFVSVAVIASALGGLTVLARVPVFVRTLGGRLKGLAWGAPLCLPILLWPPVFDVVPEPGDSGATTVVQPPEHFWMVQGIIDYVETAIDWIGERVPPIGRFFRFAEYNELPPAASWEWILATLVILGVAAYQTGRVCPSAKLWAVMLPVAATVVGGSLLWQGRGSGIGTALWPILLGGAVFLYLWWFAALLFDVILIWRRYIYTDYGTYLLRRELGRCIKPQKAAVGWKPRLRAYMEQY